MKNLGSTASISRVRSKTDILAVERLAMEIWPEHYVPITGRAQVDYMLEKFQSADAISKQVADGYEYFLICDQGQHAGYFAVVPNEKNHDLFLSKIYVRKAARGSGFGKQALQFAEGVCRERGFSLIWLTVNRFNADSIAWYQRMGFRNAGSIVQDIGGGFVMDDFRMEKPVA